MVKIIEQTGRRLKLRFDGRGASTSVCTLDLDRNTAEVFRRAFFIPYHRTRIALSNVFDVATRRRGRRKDYHTVFELKAGRSISLGGYTKEEALEAAKAIRDFLRANQNALAPHRAEPQDSPVST